MTTNADLGAGWAPPCCRHGKIILGCPDDACPEQTAYLAMQNQVLDDHYRRQQEAARDLVRSLLGLPPNDGSGA